MDASSPSLMEFLHRSIRSIPLFSIDDSSTDESQPIAMDSFFPHYYVGSFWLSCISMLVPSSCPIFHNSIFRKSLSHFLYI
jgi:hypothetical protein